MQNGTEDLSIESIKNNVIVQILQSAVDFINENKNSLNLSKDPSLYQDLNGLLQKQLIKFYNTLAAYFLKCSENFPNEIIDELNLYINKAMDISYQEPSTCIIRGFSSIVSNQNLQAEQEFDFVLQKSKDD